MLPRVVDVRYVKEYQLEVRFSDGADGILDFHQRVVGRGGVFAPMESVEFFKRVVVDQEAGTLVWPNGVDFCPYMQYAEATGTPLDELDAGAVKTVTAQ